MSVEIEGGEENSKPVAQNSKQVEEKSGKNYQSESLQARPNEDPAQLGKNGYLQAPGEKANSAKEIGSALVAIEMNQTTNGEEVLAVQDGFLSEAYEAFNWDDFLYSLLFGLLPSTLDIVTDFRFALPLCLCLCLCPPLHP